MINMATAYTAEIDDIEAALNEIMEQLGSVSLKKNSVGLVTCHYDYTQSGFIELLHQKLSFDIVGITTMASASHNGHGMYALSLTVLTSDEILFESAMTNPLSPDSYRETIETTYSNAVKKLPGQPSLIISFFPYHHELSGSVLHKAFNEVCGGIPFWGGVATNLEDTFEYNCAFRNENVEERGMSMLLMHGSINPEFVNVSMPKQNIGKTRGRITDSEGCILKTINGIPAAKYLESFGVVILKGAPIVTPLMVYYEETSEPVALGIHVLHEDGSLLCGGEMTKGASLAIGEINNEGILAATKEGITRILNSGKKNGALLLPCVSRYVMLAPNHDEEMNYISSRLENGKIMPFMIGYSGGELCPVRDNAGVLQNRFHNFTFSACVF